MRSINQLIRQTFEHPTSFCSHMTFCGPIYADFQGGGISILEIYFLHYVARFFCETIKLPIEMPKISL